MRIGIDAHIVLPKHKRYDPRIARYTEKLIEQLMEADKAQEHTWVLFFDNRMKDTKKFERKNVEIKHFPFVHYRQYLPVVYSHMLISSFLRAAKLDVFHSPEGLIPMLYPGKVVTTFHYVPKGETESNLFMRTFMLGARTAFAQLCKRADRIIVDKRSDKKILTDIHGYPEARVVLAEMEDLERVDWQKKIRSLMKVYEEVGEKKKKGEKAEMEKKEEKGAQAERSQKPKKEKKKERKRKRGKKKRK